MVKFFSTKRLMLLIMICLWAFTHNNNVSAAVRDSIPVELHFTNFDRNLDSLMRIWHVQQVIASNPLIVELDQELAPLIPEFHDSIYMQRLERLPSLVPLVYNNVVRSWIHVYTVRPAQRDRLEVMLGLTDFYFPMFDEIFDFYQVPLELRYLAVVESALNPRARSRVGATGIWQFMLATGRQYGLQVTTFVDMRRDPVASTHAAARYFRDLYNIYNDWTLAMAAYNCGPGNVNRAIRRAGGRTDYWEIYPHLPRETRGYLPAYIGATYAMNYYKEHGLTPRHIDVPPVSDTIMVNRMINLAQVSEVMNIPLQLLRDLNPQYLRDIIPGNSAPHPLRLPATYLTNYIDMEETIAGHRANVLLSNAFRPVTPNTSTTAASGGSTANTAGRDRVVHTIRSGETLGGIASRYGVTVSNLQAWNNLSTTRIVAGRQLVVWVLPRAGSTTTAAANQTASAASANTGTTAGGGNVTYHTVRSGDTVWGISRMYEGVSDADILRWNNLNRNSTIRPGMRLIIMQ